MWSNVVRSWDKTKPGPKSSVFVCSHSPCMTVMWLHASLHGRPFIFFWTLTSWGSLHVTQCHVILSMLCYSCNFPIWKGGKKAFPSTHSSDWRQSETDLSKHRSMKRDKGWGEGEMKKNVRGFNRSRSRSVNGKLGFRERRKTDTKRRSSGTTAELPHPFPVVCTVWVRVIRVLFILVFCKSVQSYCPGGL